VSHRGKLCGHSEGRSVMADCRRLPSHAGRRSSLAETGIDRFAEIAFPTRSKAFPLGRVRARDISMRASTADLGNASTVAFVFATSTRIAGDQSPNARSPWPCNVDAMRGPLHQAGRSRGMLGDLRSKCFTCVSSRTDLDLDEELQSCGLWNTEATTSSMDG
jgi:hypothetical protein